MRCTATVTPARRRAQPAFTEVRPPTYRPDPRSPHQLTGHPQEVIMRSHRRLRTAALGLAACAALAAPTGALAEPGADYPQPSTPKIVGDTPADYPGMARPPKATPLTQRPPLPPKRATSTGPPPPSARQPPAC
jgi:hypothetical protein